MTLMKLPPESVRLRRIAKAHAAGEFSLIDYRQARREVISNFKASDVGDDDTQPRWQAAGWASRVSRNQALSRRSDSSGGCSP